MKNAPFLLTLFAKKMKFILLACSCFFVISVFSQTATAVTGTKDYLFGFEIINSSEGVVGVDMGVKFIDPPKRKITLYGNTQKFCQVKELKTLNKIQGLPKTGFSKKKPIFPFSNKIEFYKK
ncbi:MAG: hypothetical protein H0W61_01145 [Bacteroidetes bacterium]|nr:hypothetical protein [Bacteroidota bacterium]